MRNIALRLAYDGTDFVGSQWQSNGRTIQGELESTWAQFTQEQKRFVFAGRTDAGVHAQGQIANVRTETRRALGTIQRGLNALLPRDIAVLDVWEVPFDFHARHSAVRREYRYLIDNAPATLPQFRHYVLHVEQVLDIVAIQSAMMYLLGHHDFAAFASSLPLQRSTMRHCYQANCSNIEMFGRSLIAIDLAANAFLHHMVRAIVGTLLLVGYGRLSSDEFGEIMKSRSRRRAGPNAPAHGLTLMAVEYPQNLMRI